METVFETVPHVLDAVVVFEFAGGFDIADAVATDGGGDLVAELDQAGLAEIARMERRLAFLALCAHTAPLLGLLGSVLGILRSLLAWRAALPLVGTAGIVDGLVEAALTTAAGLAVAIPCYLGFNVLVVKVDRLVLDMREACSECVHFFATLQDAAPHA